MPNRNAFKPTFSARSNLPHNESRTPRLYRLERHHRCVRPRPSSSAAPPLRCSPLRIDTRRWPRPTGRAKLVHSVSSPQNVLTNRRDELVSSHYASRGPGESGTRQARPSVSRGCIDRAACNPLYITRPRRRLPPRRSSAASAHSTAPAALLDHATRCSPPFLQHLAALTIWQPNALTSIAADHVAIHRAYTVTTPGRCILSLRRFPTENHCSALPGRESARQ